VKGLLGELLFLEYLLQKPLYCNNETLNGWKGPYNDEKDFFINGFAIEIKTISTASEEIRISSEYQLEKVADKNLYLGIMELNESSSGFCLQDKFLHIREIITTNSLDISILLNALRENGINQMNITKYNNYKFEFNKMEIYDATTIQFPSIVKSNISSAIKNVGYNIVISSIQKFKTNPF
jgi:hypothetical protein